MASELAQPESLSHDAAAPLTNGAHEHNLDSNADAFGENGTLPKADPSLDVNVTADSHPGGPTPVEDVAPGIAPVADFIPKDARTSHPTPPPDEPLATSDANVDAEMTMADESTKVEDAAEPATLPSSNESTLVRQREDDDEDDEPAAKRGKFETDQGEVAKSADGPSIDAAQPEQASAESAAFDPSLATAAQSETTQAGQTNAKIEPTVESAPQTEVVSASAQADVQMESQPEEPPAAALPESIATAESKAETDIKPTESQSASDVLPPSEPAPTASSVATTTAVPAATPAATTTKSNYSSKPMTKPQQRFLVEKMKNLKKTKNSTAFVNPVDHVALNIPSYPEIIKNPMDLSTMEKKLKEEQYANVQEFANDFDQIIANARAFNGDNHPVTQAGFSMEAYFRKMMETVPNADQPAPPKAQAKKASPKPSTHAAARRESRSVVATSAPPPPAALKASAPASGAGEAFALQADGTPQIRRDSTINRPARAIKPPPARELPYSKPKRKEHQLELKFCDHVLSQLKSAKYSRTNIVFLQPVDPVALNIPHYRQIVKHPMDLSTMSQKLKNGEYGKASEFKKDFELMIENCLAFNPHGNPVRDLGIEFRREFEALWNGKDKWEKAQKNAQRGTSASADEESGDEDAEEEDEDAGDDEKSAIIRHLQKQLHEMQSAMTGLIKPAKQKKAKGSTKAISKKTAAAPKVKPTAKPKAPKKVKQVTYEEKQEISEAVSRMNEEQVSELTRIITENCKKYADQEEMELEIDDLPNDVQAMLLKYVRSIFGNPTRAARAASPDDMAAMDDDDFEPERGPRRGGGGGGSKRKKHKPMGKEEQQAAINNIQKKLSQFQHMGGSASQSPVDQADTSGDEESEESEEE